MSILPGCDQCGQCGCTCGKLPYTMSVEFADLENKAHTPHAALSITSNFGTGASAIQMAPGGDTSGPLTEVLVLEGGCGYATIGHVEPVLSISCSGTGATFTPVLAPVDPMASPPCQTWKLVSVFMSGGDDCVVGESLTILAADGAVQVEGASAIVGYGRVEPTVTATAAGGSGAVLAVTLASNGDNPETWQVASVGVTSGGSGYTDGDSVSFSCSGTEDAAAEATLVTEHAEPTLAVSSVSSYTGSGATFGTPVMSEHTSRYWGVVSIPITNAGSGYALFEYLSIECVDGEPSPYLGQGTSAYVSQINGSGGIVAVTIQADYLGHAGWWYKDTGAVASVSVSEAGQYYDESGTPGAVTVTNGGEYYKEDATAEPCVAAVSVESGCGATLVADIDTTVGSPTFGAITGISITNGGEDCKAWEWQETRQESLNGVPLVLVADSPQKLVTVRIDSDFGSGACVVVHAIGERAEPALNVFAACRRDEENFYDFTSCEECQQGTVEVTLAQGEDEEGRPFWYVDSATASGGTGYPASMLAQIDPSSPCLAGELPVITVTATDGVLDGATIDNPGAFWWQLNYDGGPHPIHEIELTAHGSGYAKLVTENGPATVYVADVTATIVQLSPSAGSGAEIALTVANDPDIPQFGQITSATLMTGGDGYRILGAPQDCTYSATTCQDDHTFGVTMAFRGRGKAPRLTISEFGTDVAVLQADDVLDDCTALPETASILHLAEAGTATIAAGGADVTECEPTGYCATGYDCNDIPRSGCQNVSWSMTLTIGNPGGGGSIHSGAYSFSGTIWPEMSSPAEAPGANPCPVPGAPTFGLPPPAPAPGMPREWCGLMYDPDDTRMIRFTGNLPNGDTVVCDTPYIWESGGANYFYDSYGTGDVSLACRDNRVFVYPSFYSQGEWCRNFCLPNSFLPSAGFGYSDPTILARCEVPVERFNGVLRMKPGTHHFSLSESSDLAPYGVEGVCELSVELDLTVSY